MVSTQRLSLLISLVAACLTAACQTPRRVCGTAPEGGGPPVLTTREDEICESVRWRVLEQMRVREEFSYAHAERLFTAAETWSTSTTLEDLRRRVAAVDDEQAMATTIVDAARHAWETSKAPVSTGCETDEACVAEAAAHGARVALRRRSAYLKITPEMIEQDRDLDRDWDYLLR